MAHQEYLRTPQPPQEEERSVKVAEDSEWDRWALFDTRRFGRITSGLPEHRRPGRNYTIAKQARSSDEPFRASGDPA